jgi:hypothetical protein
LQYPKSFGLFSRKVKLAGGEACFSVAKEKGSLVFTVLDCHEL